MIFEEWEWVFGFCFNHILAGGVRKLLRVERHGLHWENGNRLDEGDIV
jgi:hypothetical protein